MLFDLGNGDSCLIQLDVRAIEVDSSNFAQRICQKVVVRIADGTIDQINWKVLNFRSRGLKETSQLGGDKAEAYRPHEVGYAGR